MSEYKTEQEAIKAGIDKTSKEGGYIKFDGKNCYKCYGWNGYDRRCYCGAYPLYWQTYYNYLNRAWLHPSAEINW